VRLQCFQRHSERTAALLADDRFLCLAELGRSGHERGAVEGANVVEALVKPIGVVEGISDLPWHKDCSIGRHSYRCCSMTVGISVTGADSKSGELGVVPGSHRASLPLSGIHRRVDLPQLPLPTATGDVTVHLSCTLHMSRPPKERERRVLYTNFVLPTRPGDSGLYDQKLSEIREAAPRTMGVQSTPSLGRATGFDLQD
jgi:ectoine hydroxylase-related dioxygenase (phytanoyl-CoA dioxygenase family)